ncbi:Methyltransferase domain-containing protein [Klenkia marina]|uniref:Methyltransferase domain-containing protein n=1 Tax=Klenkia marina TaxID=1960309 RepID=A0A1G4XE87_9ACTN|nr:class I SAM-dependent methyltransferase [Klenkia marina]SCX39435.1 Methyltransferase domain-containing protein [Klenkia marina]
MTGELDQRTWDTRRRSFGSVARDYALLRPDYPADVVAFLLGGQPRRVLDLGAGTGKLTEQLLAAGHEVLAVDPSADMLAELTARHPQVTAAVGGAESLPLPDTSVDAVVAGQAAHWFDPAATATELRRVLRPGGVVGFVWNTRDLRVPWLRALEGDIEDEARGHEADQGVVDAFAAALPADVAVHESAVAQQLSPDEVVASFATRSYVAVMADDERHRFLAGLRRTVDTHPGSADRDVLDLPYLTHAYRLTPR